jgi:hypothetical protein
MTAYQEGVSRARGRSAAAEQLKEPRTWADAPAPAQFAKKVSEGLFNKRIVKRQAPLITNVLHWSYGAALGGAYGLAASRLQRSAAVRDSRSGRPLGASRTPRSHRSASTRPRGATRRRRSGSTSRTTSSTASASPRRSASSIKEGLAKNLLCRRRRADSPRGSSRRSPPYLEPIRSRPASAASERPARPGDERHSANPS